MPWILISAGWTLRQAVSGKASFFDFKTLLSVITPDKNTTNPVGTAITPTSPNSAEPVDGIKPVAVFTATTVTRQPAPAMTPPFNIVFEAFFSENLYCSRVKSFGSVTL